jgi:hypothetical protein
MAQSLYQGMPYGGVPADMILQKLEETDPRYLPPAAGRVGDGFTGLVHKDYMIGEILDRTPDQGYLEADRARRNPQMSREVLNTRYNGTRGSAGADYPRHPEMFLGFTGDDPRGTTNDPRFEEMRKQMAHRTRLLEPTMGNSVGHDGGFGEAPHQEAERPWTGPALQKMRTAVHEDVRRRMKIFTAEKEGRSSGNNTTSGSRANTGMLTSRSAVLGAGSEQWDPNTAAGGAERSDARAFAENTRDGFVNASTGKNTRRAISLHAATISTVDMPTAKYGRTLRGRTKGSGTVANRAQHMVDRQQQDWGRTRGGRSVAGSKALVLAMSEKARTRRAAAVRDPTSAAGVRSSAGDGLTTADRPHARAFNADPEATDVARAYYQASPDQTPGVQLVGRNAVPGAALAKAARDDRSGASQQAPWRTEQNHVRGALATNMAQAARQAGQHASTADLVLASFQAVADGTRHDPFVGQKSAAHSSGRGIIPGISAARGGYDGVKQQVQAAVHATAASRNLEMANYSGAVPVEGHHLSQTNLHMLSAAAGGQRIHSAAAAQHLQNAMMAQKHPEYRGYTQVGGQVVASAQALTASATGEGLIGTNESIRTPGLRMGMKATRYDRIANEFGGGGDHGVTGDSQLGESTSDLLDGV